MNVLLSLLIVSYMSICLGMVTEDWITFPEDSSLEKIDSPSFLAAINCA